MLNNPLRYTDPSGHATWVGAFIAFDYAWTAYDSTRSLITILNPQASSKDKTVAKIDLFLAGVFQFVLPDPWTPSDDIARRALIKEIRKELTVKQLDRLYKTWIKVIGQNLGQNGIVYTFEKMIDEYNEIKCENHDDCRGISMVDIYDDDNVEIYRTPEGASHGGTIWFYGNDNYITYYDNGNMEVVADGEIYYPYYSGGKLRFSTYNPNWGEGEPDPNK